MSELSYYRAHIDEAERNWNASSRSTFSALRIAYAALDAVATLHTLSVEIFNGEPLSTCGHCSSPIGDVTCFVQYPCATLTVVSEALAGGGDE